MIMNDLPIRWTEHVDENFFINWDF